MCILYISRLSKLQRVFRSHSIPSYHKPFNMIRSLFVNPKDKTKKEKQFGVVHSVRCSDCDKEYIGETSRILGTKVRGTYWWKISKVCHYRTHLLKWSSLHHGWHQDPGERGQVIPKKGQRSPLHPQEINYPHPRPRYPRILLQLLSCDLQAMWPATQPIDKDLQHSWNVWVYFNLVSVW